jgi:hypothetical protein
VASEVTEEQAAALLKALREKNERVPEKKIGRVGRDAFGERFPGYELVSNARKKPGGAEVPVVVEAWARCDGWRRREMGASAEAETYLNRSAVLSGINVSNSREAVNLHGSGVRYSRIEAKPGRYRLIISVITPHAELISDGKAPNLGDFTSAIVEAVGKAMKSARRGVPPDDATPEEIAKTEAEARADRQAKEADAAPGAPSSCWVPADERHSGPSGER